MIEYLNKQQIDCGICIEHIILLSPVTEGENMLVVATDTVGVSMVLWIFFKGF